jgi:L-aminopeptidase/D-esterase-like protein
VTPGIKVGELTAITGGVKTGDKVVLKPSPDLNRDALVKVEGK